MKEFTGKHMLMVMLGGFGVIITVNLIMASLAIGTFPGILVKNTYVASQDYNKHLAAAKERAALAWQTRLVVDSGMVELSVADKSGQWVDDLVINGRIGRPASALEDRELALSLVGSGVYRAKEILAPGRWEVRLHGRNPADTLVIAIREDVWIDR